jgi:hypothetical protein
MWTLDSTSGSSEELAFFISCGHEGAFGQKVGPSEKAAGSEGRVERTIAIIADQCEAGAIGTVISRTGLVAHPLPATIFPSAWIATL